MSDETRLLVVLVTNGPEAEVIAYVGLIDARITARFDCYAGTSTARRHSASTGVHGVNLFARRAR